MKADSPALYRSLFDGHPAAQLLVDARDGAIVQANRAATGLFGASGTRPGAPLAELIAAPPGPHAAPLHERLAAATAPVTVARLAPGPGWRHLELEGAVITSGDESLLLISARDVTAQISAERELRDFREIFEDVPVPFYRASAGERGRFLRVNPAFVRLFDAESAEELCSYDIASLYVDPADRERFSDALLHDGEVLRYELRMRTVTGRLIWAADTAFRHLDEDGRPVFDGVLEDITLRRELEEDLARQARYDKLTELANRRHCEDMLAAEIERSERYGAPLAALMIDIDHFKRVNDERGHLEGDRILAHIAGVIRTRVRQADIPGRWGGEEFLVLLPSTRAADARRLAEELRRAVAEQHDGDDPPVTISAGYAGYRPREGELRFVQRLDRALYAAKDGGRNCVVAADPDTG